MSALEHFRDAVQWRARAGDDEVPGIRNLGDPAEIAARVIDRTVRLQGDRVAKRIVQVPAAHEVQAGDQLDDEEVLEVKAVKDGAGNVVFWVCYAEG